MRSIFAVLLIALVALSGCAESTEEGGDAPQGGDGDGLPAEQNQTLNITPIFTADAVNGTAPLMVNFTIDAVNGTDVANATWRIDFGDGNTTNGTGIPAVASHTFGPGNFTTVLDLRIDGMDLTTSVTTAVAEGAAQEPPRQLPEKLSWSFGPSLGCAGDVGTCISLEVGPGEPGIDGFFVELDELYWGLPFTSTVQNARADSDCWFVGEDGHTPIGEANNSDKACAGTVPPNAHYIFLYSYAEPSQGMTLTFVV